MNETPPLTWRQHLVAVFVTFHIVCVLLYALPRPPAVHDAILEHPEVKAELEALPLTDPQIRFLIGLARHYTRATDVARRRVTPYLDLIDSTQSWHMFGGTPPRYPLVMMVDVRPRGESAFVPFQDLNWGTPEARALNFRHFKVHENLHAWEPPSSWDAYAAYWARRWDERHPDRRALAVRLWFLRLTTPSAKEVRSLGGADRQPEPDPKDHVWERP